MIIQIKIHVDVKNFIEGNQFVVYVISQFYTAFFQYLVTRCFSFDSEPKVRQKAPALSALYHYHHKNKISFLLQQYFTYFALFKFI